MQPQIIEFAKEHILPILVAVGWYFLAGVIAAVFAKKTRIDEWCAQHPKVALVLNLLRATGFDVWKVVASIQNLVRSKAGLPPIAPTAVVLLAVGLGLAQQGCSLEAARQARVNSQLQAEKSGRLMAPTRPEAECKRLDDVHVYTLYGAELSLGVGVTAGSVAAATSGDTQKVATSVGIGTAAVAAGLAYWSNSAAARWAERCQ